MTTEFLLFRVNMVRTGGDRNVSGHLSVRMSKHLVLLLVCCFCDPDPHKLIIFTDMIPKRLARWQKPVLTSIQLIHLLWPNTQRSATESLFDQTKAHYLEHCYNHFSFLYYKLFTT